MNRRRSGQGAFTLLEMLVVLLMVSFISALLIQALAYIGKVNQSFHQHAGRKQAQALALGWFRDTVENLVVPEAGEASWRFRGDELSFEAVSTMALDRRAGVPLPFAFRLEPLPNGGGTELIYVRRLEDSRWPLLRFQGPAHFQYLDGSGRWTRDWPPAAGLADTLPDALVLAADEDRLFVLVTVLMPKVRPIDHDL
ncbi:hypothetical protein D3C84_315020 [compost metagenome]